MDVRLADGTLFRSAPGDRVPVDAVEFLPSAPRPGPRKRGAKLTRAALLAALPARSDVIDAAAAAAADAGPEAAAEVLSANGIVPGTEERERVAAGLAKWKPVAGVARARTKGGVVAPPAVGVRTSDWGLAREAPEVLGDPEGALELDLAQAAEQPALTLRAYKQWLASARREEPRDRSGFANGAKEDAAPRAAFEPAAVIEIVRAHASEYEGGRANDDAEFDDAPDFLARAPDRAAAEATREDAMERDYRERSRDSNATRWSTHLSALRDGISILPPFAVDIVSVAAIAERVLAAKAARFVRARPETSRADVDAIKGKQAAVHALAALAAFAEMAGVEDAARRLEPLVGSAHAVGKVFVETLDMVPELRHRAHHPPSKRDAQQQPAKPVPRQRSAVQVHERARQLVPLVRWWVETSKRPLPRARAQTKQADAPTESPRLDAVLLPPVADNDASIRSVSAIDHAHPYSLTTSLLRARKAGDLGDLFALQDGAFLDHLARRRIPLMMPDPSLRDLLIADAASRPPLSSHARFDAAASRRAGAFFLARALSLPRIAMQLGGADITLGAVATAFARAHSLPAPKHAAPDESTTFPSPKMRASEYERFEESELMPWLGRALRANAPKTTSLKAAIRDIRNKQNERQNEALDALDPERYKAVMELRRVGAFDEAAFERLVQEQEAEAAAEGEVAADDNDDDDGYSIAGDEDNAEEK